MKKLLFIKMFLFSLNFSNVYADWTDGIGPAIGGALGGLGATAFTANPIVGAAAGAAGSYVGRQTQDFITDFANTFSRDPLIALGNIFTPSLTKDFY